MALYSMPPLPSADKRWKIVNSTMRRYGFARHALIETLHTVQTSFGLQSVMIIADDEEFGGGTANPHEAFAGVNIEADVNPSDAFGSSAPPEDNVDVFS